ncbi:MAG: hypothetical protein CMP48_23085, partial [Rickettsiales bacterium]|nr:hypothetical protein [Rickettsiales bacterium]
NTGTSITSDQTEVIDFGSALQGSDLVQTFAIENTGTADLSISDITSSDPSFTLSSSIEIIAPGATETFTVTLSGSTAGSFTADITITNDDADEGVFVFPVTGEISIAPQPAMELYYGVSDPGELILENSTVELGNLIQGAGLEFQFAIVNSGTAKLDISSINTNPSVPVHSSLNEVLPGESGTFSVLLDDVDDGGFSIRITIDSNDPIVEVFEFLVTGFIELEEVEVVDNITDETIMTNATVDFGSTQLGSPVARSFTLFNPSTLETLEIEEMIIESDGFELIEEPTSIPPQSSVELEIQLLANWEGSNTAELSIASNFADFKLYLVGEVTPETSSIEVYNVLTPNGDGRHDFFKIAGITNYPSNEVAIFNRAGTLVYRASAYDNETTRFDGIGNQGRSGPLEPGAYYYVIKLGNGENKLGFIQILRN